MDSETGTIEKWRDVRDKTIVTLKSRGVDISADMFDRFWKAFEKLREKRPSIVLPNLKYRVMGEIVESMKDSVNVEDTVSYLENEVSNIYERMIEEDTEYDELANFFELS